ncbi:DNA polymerase V family protein [Sphingomonas sp. LaA6.9]|uniref:DNA polymerase V family protein n=1 Tax=Sphingomonas sp. LaA6.9 TaxID=2919914 RepID=UPI001F4F50B0|nr:DNA polymerase V family protein [Sphingomonas sp. LaA6.9]MCJ8157078.1 DNA polymerase V family protein [Sphingomonas sp. LaA6.9]
MGDNREGFDQGQDVEREREDTAGGARPDDGFEDERGDEEDPAEDDSGEYESEDDGATPEPGIAGALPDE